MNAALQALIAACGIITASAAVGCARWAREAAGDARLSRRVLVGENDVESDDGLVGRVDDLEGDIERVDEELEEARVAAEREVARLRRELPDEITS